VKDITNPTKCIYISDMFNKVENFTFCEIWGITLYFLFKNKRNLISGLPGENEQV